MVTVSLGEMKRGLHLSLIDMVTCTREFTEWSKPAFYSIGLQGIKRRTSTSLETKPTREVGILKGSREKGAQQQLQRVQRQQREQQEQQQQQTSLFPNVHFSKSVENTFPNNFCFSNLGAIICMLLKLNKYSNPWSFGGVFSTHLCEAKWAEVVVFGWGQKSHSVIAPFLLRLFCLSRGVVMNDFPFIVGMNQNEGEYTLT